MHSNCRAATAKSEGGGSGKQVLPKSEGLRWARVEMGCSSLLVMCEVLGSVTPLPALTFYNKDAIWPWCC